MELGQRTSNVHITTVNIRSIKNKLNLVLETILLHNLDFAILMETWLKDKDEDQARVKTSELANKV